MKRLETREECYAALATALRHERPDQGLAWLKSPLLTPGDADMEGKA